MLLLVIHQQDYHFYLLQKYLPPLAQACSLCPIHNSSFSPCPTCPICPTRPTSPIIARVAHTPHWRKLAACTQFKIQNSKFSPRPICPICRTRPTSPIIARVAHTPCWRNLVAYAQFKIHNSQFKIQIPLALFRALYRLEKLFSLWWVKGNSRAVLSISFVFSY